MTIILVILVILLLVGGWPALGLHSYGYAPSMLGLVLFIILLVVLLRGRL